MRISFRQGLVRAPTNFITILNGKVSLTIPPSESAIVTFADGNSNYLLTERTSIADAWVGPFLAGTDYWLYWDINTITGARTFGHTTLSPVEGAIAPSNPQLDQHWFDTTTNTMNVWVGSHWTHRIRVFAAKLASGSLLVSMSIASPSFVGTQVGSLSNIELEVGSLVFDATTGTPIKKSDGTFFTTEDTAITGIASSSQVKLGSLVLEAEAQETIPAFSVVRFSDFGKVALAIAFTTSTRTQYGIVQNNALPGDIVTVTVDGIVTNPLWDWSIAGINTYVYTNNTGVISATPTMAGQQPIGIIVDVHSIMIIAKTIITNAAAPLASTTTAGLSRLSVTPVDSLDPVVVGNNDPRLSDARTPIDHTHAISTLDGVIINTPLNGQALTYDGVNWVNSAIASDLGGLTDVSITTPSTGQALTFNGTNWVNATPTTTLVGLDDVTLTSPVVGQALTFNGTDWVNATPASTLVDLTDVTLTAPTNGQALTFDGTNWINTTLAGGEAYVLSEWFAGNNGYGMYGNGSTSSLTRWSLVNASVTPTQVPPIFSGTKRASYKIESDGTLWTWGDNTYGQLGLGDTTSRYVPTQVGTSTNWKSISRRFGDTLHAIKTDGTLWTCGYNSNGELGLGNTVDTSVLTQVGTDTNWKLVNGGWAHTVGIKTDGTLWTCGYNEYGDLGIGTNTTANNKSSFVQVGTLTDWKYATGGWDHTVAIKTDGTLWTWGYNSAGNLGNGTTNHQSSPIQIGSLTDWKMVDAAANTTVAIKTDGTIWAWGSNDSGQLGLGDTTNRSSPVQVGTATDWDTISCGYYHMIATKKDGTLWGWGSTSAYQLGYTADQANILSPTQIGTATGWKNVLAFPSTTYIAGYDISPERLVAPATGTVTSIAFSTGSTGLIISGSPITSSGTLTLSGKLGIGYGGTGATTATGALTALLPSQSGKSGQYLTTDGTSASWTTMSASGEATLPTVDTPEPQVLTNIGSSQQWREYLLVPVKSSLWMTGQNGFGQFGTGNTKGTSLPIFASTGWSKISCGYEFTTAIKSDGTLWTWGNNIIGQLGDGTTTNRSSPTQIGIDADWTNISAGFNFVAATKVDGTLWMWGGNAQGQLGDGTVIAKSSPIQVGSLTDWKTVDVGKYFTVALKVDGSLWAWGYNNSGELGDGTRTHRSSPIQIGSLTDWKSISAGDSTNAAIKTDGTLWTWGSGTVGQLANGSSNKVSSPIQVGSLTNWKYVSMYSQGMAIKTDGTLWVWGSNSSGKLGIGSTINKSSPVQVGALSDWVYAYAGFSHGIGIRADGSAWTCGYNGFGQLGDGTTISKSSPVQVGIGTRWKNASGGKYITGLIANDIGDPASTPTPNTIVLRDSNGDIYANQFLASSDINLKENVRPIETPDVLVDSLIGHRFKMKATQQESFGFIAQEVEQVLPELVTSSGETKSVNYDAVIGILVEAVKKLKERLDNSNI